MKKRIDLFWYFFLIIVAFVVCFMFSSTKASAALVGGETPGDVNVPGSTEESNLYEQCHTYITTNIISAESLSEALGDKIYTTFTQEDCMEMINIASKREVIKNLFDFSKIKFSINNIDVDYVNESITVRQAINNTTSVQLKTICPDLIVGETYIFYMNTIDKKYIYLYGSNTYWYVNTARVITQSDLNSYLVFYGIDNEEVVISDIQIEKGTKKTPYVSYDYHREYYEEGITDANNRVNTNSASYIQGVTDADNRVNTDSVNYKTGQAEGYKRANKEGKVLGDFIPSLLGGFGSFFLTLLNIDILGFNLLTVLGILITVLGIVVVIKFLKG